MSLAVIGLFVLWLGWFGFNPGSTMSFQNPTDVFHILMTTNTSAIAAVLTSTITSWIVLKKPDLGMTINGCLAGLVGVTGGCAYVSIEVSLLIGAVAGILVVFAVGFFDRRKIDDPVGATSVHLCCGVFGTICVGLFAQEGVTSLSTTNGLFFGGGFGLLGVQLLGIVAIGGFTFASSAVVWLLIKKTMGIRVSSEEEIQGLDIGEHGNIAYPDFVRVAEPYGHRSDAIAAFEKEFAEDDEPLSGNKVETERVSVEKAVPVEHHETAGAKMTKVSILINQNKFIMLQEALDSLGITGITVTNVLGYGYQKGHSIYFRGNPVDSRLLPKIKVEVVVSKIPVDTLVKTVRECLYTGKYGDGKIFIYDVEDVIKIRTGEHGYKALQDLNPEDD